MYNDNISYAARLAKLLENTVHYKYTKGQHFCCPLFVNISVVSFYFFIKSVILSVPPVEV